MKRRLIDCKIYSYLSIIENSQNFNGERLWIGGCAVFTVGFEEQSIRNYIRNQERLDGIGSNEIGDFYLVIGSL
jgi:putative transposase